MAPAERHREAHVLVANGTRAGWCDPVGPGRCQPEGVLAEPSGIRRNVRAFLLFSVGIGALDLYYLT